MELTKKQIKFIEDGVRLCNYTIEDGKVNVDGSFIYEGRNLKEIPVKFGVVHGDFAVSRNQLTTLKNCPDYVDGYFDCSYNNISSLEELFETELFKCRIFASNNPIDKWLDETLGDIQTDQRKRLFAYRLNWHYSYFKNNPSLINRLKDVFDEETIKDFINQSPSAKSYLE